MSQEASAINAVVCSRCNCVIPVNGVVPPQCPDCGSTLGNARDVTRSLPLGTVLAETIIQTFDEHPIAIGRYIVERELGSGGFGIVYLAYDEKLNRHVAIKLPKGSRLEPHHKERFAREARNAAQLRHPGIVSVYNVEEEGNLVFIVSEYVAGLPLDRHLKQNEISFRTAASLTASIAWAVEYAHSQKIIHRDVKPSNIMIDAEGNPRLMDFGLAKREEADETITAANQVLGTPAFMSPEQAWGKQGKTKQAEGEHKVDRRSDVYSVGAVLYQLLTRELPFRGEPQVVRRKVIEDDPKRPREINPQIPVDLERICTKAMAKEPSDRYRTAGDLAADLERWLRGEPILARHVGPRERLWRLSRRNPLASGLVAAIALLVTLTACCATAMYAVEHKAKTRLEQALLENREMLSKSYVERASRHLGPEGVVEAYSPIKALPWLYAAMEIDESNPGRRDASRLRLGAALRSAPSVEKIWSHGGTINVAAFSPMGNHFFTGGHDGIGRLWEAAKEEATKPNLIHPASVTSAEFSPDGKLLLTGCADGGARLWEVSSAKLLGRPFRDEELDKQQLTRAGAPAADHRAVFSDTGRFFVTVRGRTVQAWQTATGHAVGHPFIARARVASAELRRADSLLLVACSDGSMSAVDVQTGKERHHLKASLHPTLALPALAPDGKTIAVMRSRESLAFWNPESDAEGGIGPFAHVSPVTVIQFSPDNRLLATGASDGTVCLWRLRDGRLAWKRRFVPAQVHDLHFADQADQLAITHASAGGVVVVDTERGNLVAEPILLPSSIKLARWVGLTGIVATAGYDGAVRFWRIAPQEPAFLLPHSQNLRCAAVSGDRRLMATIDRAGICCLLPYGERQAFERANATTFPPQLAKAARVCLSTNGSRLAIADSKSAVATFDVAKACKPLALVETSAPVVAMAFCSNGRYLVTLPADGRAAVWNAETGERIRQEQVDVNRAGQGIDIQPSGDLWVIAKAGQFFVWDPLKGTRQVPQITHESSISSCRLSPDARFVLIGSSDWIARVWDAASGKLIAATPKLPQAVQSIAFSPDGARFATGCLDGTARIWRTVDAAPLTGRLGHGEPVTGCTFSPNGRLLVTTSGHLSDQSSAAAFARGWDSATGEPLFVRPMTRFRGLFPLSSASPITDDFWRLASVFFSADGRRLEMLTAGGVLASLDVAPDARSAGEFSLEVGVRSGTQSDSNGGLSLVNPDQLVSTWNSRPGKH